MSVRVLHVLGSAQRDWTGIANVIAQTLPELARRGYHADALFLGADGPLTGSLAIAGAGVGVVRWAGGARDPIGALRYWSALRAGRYDIVQAHLGGRMLLLLSGLATGSRVLYHVHSRVRELDDRYHESPIRTTGADAVVAVSRSVAEAVSGSRPTVVYAGVTVPPPAAPGTRADSPPVIGAAGRLTEGKGYADLIRALALLPARVRLEIAGDGPARDSLARIASDLGVADRVTLLGWVPDMSPLFARWTLFAHPSREEGFSTAILEAMAAGLAVVATPVGGVAEAIVDGESGLLVPHGQPAELASAIGRALAAPALLASLGGNARERVTRHFSVQHQVDAMEQVYQSLLRA